MVTASAIGQNVVGIYALVYIHWYFSASPCFKSGSSYFLKTCIGVCVFVCVFLTLRAGLGPHRVVLTQTMDKAGEGGEGINM